MRTYTSRDYRVETGIDRVTGDVVAVAREFPSLSWVDESRSAAAQGLRDLLDDVLDDMYSLGEEPPTPSHLRVAVRELKELQLT